MWLGAVAFAHAAAPCVQQVHNHAKPGVTLILALDQHGNQCWRCNLLLFVPQNIPAT